MATVLALYHYVDRVTATSSPVVKFSPMVKKIENLKIKTRSERQRARSIIEN
ncbi:hypothetical protein RUND412_009130, partial [Rhizina undulata]